MLSTTKYESTPRLEDLARSQRATVERQNIVFAGGSPKKGMHLGNCDILETAGRLYKGASGALPTALNNAMRRHINYAWAQNDATTMPTLGRE